MESPIALTPATTPVNLDLKKDERLTVRWQDGVESIYPIAYLRTMCPCATCKVVREEKSVKKPLLRILPGNYADPLSASRAELIGNYALKIEWSDGHSSGIYSFQYLRDIVPTTKV